MHAHVPTILRASKHSARTVLLPIITEIIPVIKEAKHSERFGIFRGLAGQQVYSANRCDIRIRPGGYTRKPRLHSIEGWDAHKSKMGIGQFCVASSALYFVLSLCGSFLFLFLSCFAFAGIRYGLLPPITTMTLVAEVGEKKPSIVIGILDF